MANGGIWLCCPQKEEQQKYDPVRRREGWGEKTALTFEEKGRKAPRMGIMHELPAADVSAADSQS